MQRTTKPETSRSMSAMTYHQSPSLVSLPMLPRPSTAAMASTLALPNVQADHQKRQRVNSKAGALGSLFRTKIHAKRGSNAGSEGMSPVLEPLADLQMEASWEVSIDSPVAMSPLFTDECLQQLLGSSPQLTANGPTPPLGGPPTDGELATGGSPSARRSKREIAASVLHTSAVPFRRLRQGPANKTLSFPPSGDAAMYGNNGGARPGGDEFVVVTPDMCPPAAMVSSSVISGVSPLEASAAAAAAAAASVASGIDSDSTRSGRGASRSAPRKLPRGGEALPLRTRALTQVSQQSGEQLLLMGYEDSTDSLVRISTPSLSASSSEASLPLSHTRKKPPAPLLAWSQPRPRHGGFQLSQGSAPGSGARPPLPRQTNGGTGSPRKASECSFSSAEGLRRVSPFGPLDALSPYTVSRLNTTAARATERRRRSFARRSRPNSVASSVNWNLSATSDTTLLAGSAHARHIRNASESSEFLSGFTAGVHGSPFDFQLHSAAPEPLWPPDASPLASDGEPSDDDDDLARRVAASGFPSSCSAHFNIELGRDTESACESPRTRTRSSGANAPRDAARSPPARVYPRASRAIMSLLDPSSPVHEDTEHSMALNMLGRPRRQRAHTSAVPDAEREEPAELSDPLDFDGLTLTQQNDWQLMNPSSSDNDAPPPSHHSHTRRRVRKRRVLPKSMFPVPAKHVLVPSPAHDVSAPPKNEHLSSDTLRLRSDAATRPTIAIRQPKKSVATEDVSRRAVPLDAATPAPPLEMQRLLRLEVIPRTPLSIQCDMRIAHVARLSLRCSGDAHSWQPARIPCFDLRLAACLGRAHGLVEVSLVNLGLTSVPARLLSCRGLRSLDMAHNWIDTAPGWLGRLRCLEHLRLAGNPLRMVSADLVELRHHLVTLDIGRANDWSLLSRRPTPPPTLSPDKRKRVLAARLQSTAARRVATYLDSAVLKATQRQHDKARAHATRLLGLYSDTLYAALREPRNWGHSVAMPLPSGF
ncbi:hypothetical protein H4R24_000774 [Coemansia sp. RSA 988]|nr:hypothetical protein H4R24_000774 [Coemansia sp. RSA 988]